MVKFQRMHPTKQKSKNLMELESNPKSGIECVDDYLFVKQHPLHLLYKNLEAKSTSTKQKVVLVATGNLQFFFQFSGAFCPLHRMHIEMFEVAKKHLESEYDMDVIGGFISPSHGTLVLIEIYFQIST